MGIDIQAVLTLAGIGIAVWACLVFFMLWRLGIYNREALRELSIPEAVVIIGLAYSSADLIRTLFSRFA